MSEPFLGEIRAVGFNFAPLGWALCNGQILPIQQNTALFSLFGTFYGGNGQSTFALPDLQGRAPMGWGNGAGLTPRDLGEAAGSESVVLQPTQIPAHTHTVVAQNSRADRANANGASLAVSADKLYAATNPSALLSPNSLGLVGSSAPHNNMQPFLTLNFIVALQGIFPARP